MVHPFRVGAPFHNQRALAQRADAIRAEHHVGAMSEMLDSGHTIQRRPGQHIDPLNRRIAHDQAPHRPAGDRGLQRQCDDPTRGQRDAAKARHRPLHHQRASGGPQARRRRTKDEGRKLVAYLGRSSFVISHSSFVIKPACDRIAAEADHAAAKAIHLGDQRIVYLVELAGQLLGAAPRAKRAHQRLGQRREAGDIGEQHCAARAAEQRRAAGQGVQPIGGKVGG